MWEVLTLYNPRTSLQSSKIHYFPVQEDLNLQTKVFRHPKSAGGTTCKKIQALLVNLKSQVCSAKGGYCKGGGSICQAWSSM